MPLTLTYFELKQLVLDSALSTHQKTELLLHLEYAQEGRAELRAGAFERLYKTFLGLQGR